MRNARPPRDTAETTTALFQGRGNEGLRRQDRSRHRRELRHRQAIAVAIRHLLADGRSGAIVNVSSVHQIIPKPKFLSYSVSKRGTKNLTRTLALEYAGRNIRVNGIGPGATVTPINRASVDDPVKREMVVEHIPMRRAGESDEMAAATAFLPSDGDAVPREVLDPSSHLGGRLGTSAVAHQNSTVRFGD
jgi:NAD(P)-dependent dehydrogenase (short-subunit alcohol dehydrogenase family)